MGFRTTPVIQLLCLALAWVSSISVRAEKPSASISFAEIGAKATADYQGDALGITATAEGARLRCAFQRLDGDVTPEGLWLTSSADNSQGERFQVLAVAVGREGDSSCQSDFSLPFLNLLPVDVRLLHSPAKETTADSRWLLEFDRPLAHAGKVVVTENLVRFIRPGLTEEYSVSVDGVRQDFVIAERPGGSGELRVELALSGARAEATAYGAKLKLDGSGRPLAYSRLRVRDAAGRELPARLEVLSPDRLAVRVDDANATYPVRIDPTFSDEDWIGMGGIPGADSVVYAVAVDGHGNLYIGGYFTVAGETNSNRIAKWNGTGWCALGLGMNGTVYALVASGSNVYAGGAFTMAGGKVVNGIAKWDGDTWSGLGSGMNGQIYALAVSDNNVYAGGTFTMAGDNAASSIAKWDGNNWSALGTGMTVGLPYVYALAVSGSNVYAGGTFGMAGGTPANRVARWDGTSWSALGSGMNNAVYALAMLGTNLYAGGAFTKGVAKWDGSSWSAVVGSMGLGMPEPVKALAVLGGYLVAGGQFSTVDGNIANSIAVWNGSSWSAVGAGMNNEVNALAVSGTDLYAGGAFVRAGGNAACRIARWNTNSWSAVGSGMKGDVYAVATSGSNVYAGGTLSFVGTNATGRVVRWNGIGWSALGSGIGAGYITDAVYALAVDGSNIFAGGEFATAGGSAAHRIARWNGTTWSALGSGMNGKVYALASTGANLYAGGGFTTAGGVAARCIARWNGSTWSALGLGLNSNVYALAVSGSDLFVGGEFTRATNTGGAAITVNRIAKWSGGNWSALGTGMNSNVSALVFLGSDLYAGGGFTTAGGNTAKRIAKWDGSNWLPLALGFNNSVRSLAAWGSDVFAGGEFTTVGGSPANYIARWNGSSWSPLGSGVGSAAPYSYHSVHGLAVSGSQLYVGGAFPTAGGKVSAYIAQANLIPQRGVIQNIGVGGGAVALDCLGLPTATYAVERATDVLFTADLTTLLTTNAPVPDGLFRCTDSNPPSATAFYRLLRQ